MQIDALSYDFYPLQGMPPETPVHSETSRRSQKAILKPPTPKMRERKSRISALEVAIRAQVRDLNTLRNVR